LIEVELGSVIAEPELRSCSDGHDDPGGP